MSSSPFTKSEAIKKKKKLSSSLTHKLEFWQETYWMISLISFRIVLKKLGSFYDFSIRTKEGFPTRSTCPFRNGERGWYISLILVAMQKPLSLRYRFALHNSLFSWILQHIYIWLSQIEGQGSILWHLPHLEPHLPIYKCTLGTLPSNCNQIQSVLILQLSRNFVNFILFYFISFCGHTLPYSEDAPGSVLRNFSWKARETI